MALVTMSHARRPFLSGRRVALALVAGAGLALSPRPAQAAPAAPAATVTAAVAAPNLASQIAIDTALGQQGKRYAWGGTGPNSFDCSGLAQFSYRAAGINLPRTSRAQSVTGAPIARGDLQPGDLVFFYKPVGHVGIYIGNGQMVHAPTSGQTVKVVPVDSVWGFSGARRVA